MFHGPEHGLIAHGQSGAVDFQFPVERQADRVFPGVFLPPEFPLPVLPNTEKENFFRRIPAETEADRLSGGDTERGTAKSIGIPELPRMQRVEKESARILHLGTRPFQNA